MKAKKYRVNIWTFLMIAVIVGFQSVQAQTPTPGPYHGPVDFPCRIEAEFFDYGGLGVAYFDDTAGNAGNCDIRNHEEGGNFSADLGIINTANEKYYLGWTADDPQAENEWWNYTVDVPVAGEYDIDFVVASALDGASFSIQVNGSSDPVTVTVPNTGGWSTWTTVTAWNFHLDAGPSQVFTISAESDIGFNLDCFGSQTAYPSGMTHQVPGIIQAEDFDIGGQGIAYCDKSPFNNSGNYNYRTGDGIGVDISQPHWTVIEIVDFQEGEWVEYSVDVLQTGTYSINLFTQSTNPHARVLVKLNGHHISGLQIIPSEGYSILRIPHINLVAGDDQILRIEVPDNNSGFEDCYYHACDQWKLNMIEVELTNVKPVVVCCDDIITSTNQRRRVFAGVTDDGLPALPGEVNVTWNKIEGPGEVDITDIASTDTEMEFSEPGIYKMRLWADDQDRGFYTESNGLVAWLTWDPFASDQEMRRAALKQMKEAGVQTVRIQVTWEGTLGCWSYEDEPDYTLLNAILSDCQEIGIGVMPLLGYSTWYCTSGYTWDEIPGYEPGMDLNHFWAYWGPWPPKDDNGEWVQEYFDEYIAGTVNNCKLFGVNEFELWNEPNFSHFWRPEAKDGIPAGANSQEYLEWLRLASSAILGQFDNREDVTIVLGGLTQEESGFDYLRELYELPDPPPPELTFQECFDVVNLHPYDWFQGRPFALDNDIRLARGIMEDNSDHEKPITIGEFGVSSYQQSEGEIPDWQWQVVYDEQDKANLLSRAYTSWYSAESEMDYLDKVFWYCYYGREPIPEEDNWGSQGLEMVQEDGLGNLIPLPAYYSYQSLSSFDDVIIGVSGPFKEPYNIPDALIQAEDYNLGSQGAAYNDVTPGNQGGQYREDDVDIEKDPEIGYYVTHFDESEWMTYSVNVPRAGQYQFHLCARTRQEQIYPVSCRIELIHEETTTISEKIKIPYNGLRWEWFSTRLDCAAGENQLLRVRSVNGTFDLNELRITL